MASPFVPPPSSSSSIELATTTYMEISNNMSSLCYFNHALVPNPLALPNLYTPSPSPWVPQPTNAYSSTTTSSLHTLQLASYRLRNNCSTKCLNEMQSRITRLLLLVTGTVT
eukprot:TRINITY_DN15848_c0_g1_i1.p2 TRINITY_DN15848_c0_g1~~TRINITY_DN15848_c0_g1_i1.p2  ORF type:complete len:124 (+),score=7.78 TRINITY_DN15848_c0_g1_i1:38-373(+)